MDFPAIQMLFFFAVLIFSVIIHEVSHGAVALKLGDPTAKYAGRLTLNPIPHIDPIGSIILPLLLIVTGAPILIGWAKPVPINPLNFRDMKWGTILTGIAGPTSNLIVAFIFAMLIRFVPQYFPAILPLLPFFSMIVILNIVLALFNLVPIPPLDGSRVLFSLLPISEETRTNLERFGIFFILIFILFFVRWIFILSFFVYQLMTGGAPIFF